MGREIADDPHQLVRQIRGRNLEVPIKLTGETDRIVEVDYCFAAMNCTRRRSTCVP